MRRAHKVQQALGLVSAWESMADTGSPEGACGKTDYSDQ